MRRPPGRRDQNNTQRKTQNSGRNGDLDYCQASTAARCRYMGTDLGQIHSIHPYPGNLKRASATEGKSVQIVARGVQSGNYTPVRTSQNDKLLTVFGRLSVFLSCFFSLLFG